MIDLKLSTMAPLEAGHKFKLATFENLYKAGKVDSDSLVVKVSRAFI